MEATVFYLLMHQKYINSKQKGLNKNHIYYIWGIFRRLSQLRIAWKIKTVLNGYDYNYPVDYNIDNCNIINIHKYLMKIIWYKIMLEVIKCKKVFVLLTNIVVNASNHTNCVSASNQKCKIQPALMLLLIYIAMNTVKNNAILLLSIIDFSSIVTLFWSTFIM